MATVCAVVGILCPLHSYAQSTRENNPKSGASASGSTWRINRFAAIHLKWRQVRDAVQAGDMESIRARGEELSSLRIETGIRAFEKYSNWLISAADRKFHAADYDGAQVCLRIALELSPDSPRVILNSLPVVEAMQGKKAAGRQLRRVFFAAMSFPSIWMKLLKTLLYPTMWAITLGLYAATAGFLLWNTPDIMRRVAMLLPHQVRGFITPILSAVIFCVPTVFGPVWCLVAWSCLLLLLLPKQTWLPLYTGVLLMLWGAAIPLRENLEVWLKNPAMQALMRIQEGVYEPGDKSRLVKLLRRQPDLGVGWFAYGEQLKRQGAYSHAAKAFLEAEKFLGSQSFTVAEQASLAFLQDDYQQADRLFSEIAEDQGDQAAFWINYSKVKFQLREEEASSAYLAKAERLDPKLTALYRNHEQRFGLRSYAAVADMGLPTSYLFNAASKGSPDMAYLHDGVAHILINGFTPKMLLTVGVLFLLLFCVVKRRKVSAAVKGCYCDCEASGVVFCLLHLLPGGGWIIADRSGLAMGAMAFCSLAIMPILKWPAESKYLLESVPQVVTGYIVITTLVILLLYSLASQDLEDR
ncbi:MAG: hypothetical protein GX589_02600 [Deltaproteobacteria bacterium]|nr:hypothetical protein [Deltaproteobacteria bacterium]